MIHRLAIGFILIASSCNSQVKKDVLANAATNLETINFITPKGTSIKTRINTPSAYTRADLGTNAFGNYLRNIPLKENGVLVKYFNGAQKSNDNIYCAVVNKPIGNRDLHQCADAVMYLWASYLFDSKKYADIKFKFLNDNKWSYYTQYTKSPADPKIFFKYIQEVWGAANTRSLSTQVNNINYSQLQVGDFLLQVGNPYGHAILIVDECIDSKTGKKLYLLAQSYMPAQETQVLLNPANSDGNPWYDLSTAKIVTPEWTFTNKDFKRF